VTALRVPHEISDKSTLRAELRNYALHVGSRFTGLATFFPARCQLERSGRIVPPDWPGKAVFLPAAGDAGRRQASLVSVVALPGAVPGGSWKGCDRDDSVAAEHPDNAVIFSLLQRDAPPPSEEWPTALAVRFPR